MPKKVTEIPDEVLIELLGEEKLKVQQVANELGITRAQIIKWIEPGARWHHFVVPRSSPLTLAVPGEMPTGTLSSELAVRVRATPAKSTIDLSTEVKPLDEDPMMAHAFYWAGCGLKIFPAEKFVGTPLLDERYEWSTSASIEEGKLIKWWTKHPEADIAASPHHAGCYVIEITGSYRGADFHTREEFEAEWGPTDPLFVTENRYGDVRLWFPGLTFSRKNFLGRGVNIIARGSFTFLPPSHALGAI